LGIGTSSTSFCVPEPTRKPFCPGVYDNGIHHLNLVQFPLNQLRFLVWSSLFKKGEGISISGGVLKSIFGTGGHLHFTDVKIWLETAPLQG